MKAPQITMIVIYALGLGIDLVKHGEPRHDKYNFFTSLFGIAINVAILYWGGFFG